MPDAHPGGLLLLYNMCFPHVRCPSGRALVFIQYVLPTCQMPIRAGSCFYIICASQYTFEKPSVFQMDLRTPPACEPLLRSSASSRTAFQGPQDSSRMRAPPQVISHGLHAAGFPAGFAVPVRKLRFLSHGLRPMLARICTKNMQAYFWYSHSLAHCSLLSWTL